MLRKGIEKRPIQENQFGLERPPMSLTPGYSEPWGHLKDWNLTMVTDGAWFPEFPTLPKLRWSAHGAIGEQWETTGASLIEIPSPLAMWLGKVTQSLRVAVFSPVKSGVRTRIKPCESILSQKSMISLFLWWFVHFTEYLNLKHCLLRIAAIRVLKLSRCSAIHFLAVGLVVGLETIAQGLWQSPSSIVFGHSGKELAMSGNGDANTRPAVTACFSASFWLTPLLSLRMRKGILNEGA